jgi:heat shock protein HtpX
MSSGFKTAVLLGGMSGLLMLAGGLIGGNGGLMIAFVMAVCMNVFSYWFSDKMVLRMYHATEVGEDHLLYRVVARLAQRAQLPMPKVYTIPEMSPNAFATGRDPQHAAVAATEGILRLLSESELEGVIGHELTHVKNRDILISTVAATLAATIMMLASMARWAMIFGGFSRGDRDRGANPLALLAMALLAPLAAGLIQAAISRQREYAADRGGAELAGTPMGLVSALRRIEAGVQQVPLDANPATEHMFIIRPFSAQGLMSLFSSHPPTEARVKALMDARYSS